MARKRLIPKSYLWAGLFTLLVVGWLASGKAPEWLNATGEPDAAPLAEQTTPAEDLFRVSIREFVATDKPSEIIVRGRTEANRRVEARARTSGIVEQVARREGERIAQGDLLCQLDNGVREAKLEQERAALESARIDFKAADSLAQQNFASQTKRASEKAKLDAAIASVESMEREITYTAIKAPVSGILETQAAELGSFLQVGGHCATIVDLDPLYAVVHVGQQNISAIEPGMNATVGLITGETVRGKVSFIAPAADETTRTFRVEITLANPDFKLREGVTTDVIFELSPVRAHRLPSSVLTLSDDGDIGVKTVDGNNVVRFAKITILADDRSGIWVAGLPEKTDIVTVGQDYILEGQKVDPVRDSGSDAQ